MRTMIWWILFLMGWGVAGAAGYDPLALAPGVEVEELQLQFVDGKRKRELPVKVYLGKEGTGAGGPAPVVLFSHGLGGSREGSAYLGRHWASRGYVAVFLQHPGSDTSVWQGQPMRDRMGAMEAAASGRNFTLRVEDVPAVLDQLAKWQGEAGHPLEGRLDLGRVGMSGHSFGAVTTQAVSGQGYRGRQPFTDARIDAALPMSPSSPKRGGEGAAKEAFGKVGIPWMLMTGTKDTSPIGDTTVENRLNVFPHLPPGKKYELVLDGAEHSAFTERALPGENGKRNPNHHRAILALSTAFWDATLRGEAAAQAWLDGEGARGVLEAGDRWQRK